MTSKATDQTYLSTRQYQDATNLNARIVIHARFSVNPYGWHRWVFDQWDLPANARILELGCGSGALWERNAERIPSGWDLTLTDFSPGILADARRTLSALPRAFAFAITDAQALPFADAAFDAVVANHMLYHIPDKPKAFAEIRRVLKAGGCLYAATNGMAHMQELYALERQVLMASAKTQDIDLGQIVPAHSSFVLENGHEQLAPFFESIKERCYEDGLRVTEVEPLIAYVFSGIASADIGEAALEALRRHLTDELARTGAITITKAAGMFIALKSQNAA